MRSHHFMTNRWGKSGISDRLYFLGLQNHCGWWLQAWNQKKKSYDKNRQHIKKQRHHFANKDPYTLHFFSGQVQMWELDYKKDWALKNWYFWTVVLEKTLESPLDSKIKSVNPKGNQPWIFIGRTDAEAPISWSPDAKSQLIGKDSDSGKDWRQKKQVAEDEIC